MLRIAVILPGLLQHAGLTAVLERYFAPVEVAGYRSLAGLQEEGSPAFDYYFTDASTFTAGIDFFLPRRSQCGVLTPTRPGPLSDAPDPVFLLPADATLEELLEGLERFLAPADATEDLRSDELSAREIQVLQLIVTGAINKEIADRLNISLNTVLTHRKNITAKLGIKTVSGLTLYALMHGYISNEDITL